MMKHIMFILFSSQSTIPNKLRYKKRKKLQALRAKQLRKKWRRKNRWWFLFCVLFVIIKFVLRKGKDEKETRQKRKKKECKNNNIM